MKEQNKIPERELNEMEITNQSDTEFKTLVIRMLKELIKYSKNMREEIKFTLSEIKRNLQETNSGEDEVENQINDLKHKEGKSIQSEQQEEKKNSKKQGQAQEPLGQLQTFQHLNHRGARRKRGRGRN